MTKATYILYDIAFTAAADILFLRFEGFEKSHWISMKITSSQPS